MSPHQDRAVWKWGGKERKKMKGFFSTHRSRPAALFVVVVLFAVVLLASPVSAGKDDVQSLTVGSWEFNITEDTGTLTAVDINWQGYPKATGLLMQYLETGQTAEGGFVMSGGTLAEVRVKKSHFRYPQNYDLVATLSGVVTDPEIASCHLTVWVMLVGKTGEVMASSALSSFDICINVYP
jgi:hypothetical protein